MSTVSARRGGPAWTARTRAAAAVLCAVLGLHGTLLVRGGFDAHKLFGFRPFNESDTWQAEVVRILADGSEIAIDDGTWVYDWDELVGTAKLRRPQRTRHASAGAAATLDFLQRALDWVVVNTPDDPDTVALVATVTVTRNAGDPELVVLRADVPR